MSGLGAIGFFMGGYYAGVLRNQQSNPFCLVKFVCGAHKNSSNDLKPEFLLPQNDPDDVRGIFCSQDARRADSYRFRAVNKTNGNEIANEIVSDSQISLVLNAAAGTIVVLTVTGRNSAGESPAPASDPVEFTVP